MQTIDFFRALYGDNFPGFIVFFDKEIKRSACIEAPQLNEELIDQGDDSASKDIYFGVCLQEKRVPSYMRGKSATTCAMPGVWLDVDFKKDNGKNYPPDMDTALNLLGEFPLEPTIIVHSGGGLHVYWLFTSLWVFGGSEDRLYAQTLLKRFNQHFKAMFKEHGYHLDSTGDLARVLRVPGTINTKCNCEVRVIHESDQRYTPEEIESTLLESEPELEPETGEGIYDTTWNGIPASAAVILERCAFIRHCRDDAKNLPEPEWYAMLSILGRCQGGEDICHIFSQPYPRYSREETQAKLEHALTAAGPYTCKYIRENITDDFCRNCRETVKSPISLRNQPGSAPGIKIIKLSEVKREDPEFLIYPFLPRGEITLLDGDPGVGKALALDTLIPTPNGFKKMGEIKVGDIVYDGNGQETVVTRLSPIFHNHKCYKVYFDDGTTIIADADHLWLVQTAQQRTNVRRWRQSPKRAAHNKQPGYSVVTTEEIARNIKVERGKKSNYSIDIKPFAGRHRGLLIPPYVLGVWLGDGTSREAEITTADEEILEFIKNEGISVSAPYYSTFKGKAKTYRIGSVKQINRTRTPDGKFNGIADDDNKTLSSKLRQLNLLNNKHIPQEYLFSSFDQRLALLQGLMDTDGAISKNGTCEFTSTNKRLAEAVSILLASLGIKNTITTKTLTSNSVAYRVHFTTNLTVFRLRRKKERLPKKVRPSVKRRYITNVEEVESVPVRCITVSSPEHTYMCTNQFVVTHNSWIWMALAAGLTGSRTCKIPYDHTTATDRRILILTTEDSISKTVRGRLDDLGADLDKISLIVGPEGDTITAEHFDSVKPDIERLNPDLIVVDPVTLYATTEKSFDSDKAVSVRKMLNKLLLLTRQINCAAIVCRHMRKEGGRAIHRGLGSIDFAAVSRSMLVAAQDPKDDTRCLVAHAKSNLAPKLHEALVYTLSEYDKPPFQWQGTCDADPDELTGGRQSTDREDKNRLEEAKEFLQSWLSDDPAPASEVIKAARESGISEASLRRAKKDLGIIAKKSGKVWLWQLP